MSERGSREHQANDPGIDRDRCPVIVVGIGASAGGLQSIKRLFARMPTGHGIAFVLVQHLDPSHENLTVKLLRDQTNLSVVEATDGMTVLPDRVHIIPPNRLLSVVECSLTLQEPAGCTGIRMPIDHFFCTLASDQGRRSCGILLSGAGNDGTVGLSEIKAARGTTIVEHPGSAEFPSMPQSAIDASVVDAVLQVEAIAETVVELAKQISTETCHDTESPEFDAHLRAVLEILYLKVGHDFRCYKPSTLVRRIRRRMTMRKILTFADYAEFLQEHPEEIGLLQKDLLIGVTEFFRQEEAWAILEEKVIVPLVESAQSGTDIRTWVPGCSTGKEAYSLAILLNERIEKSGKKVDIQIFATDTDTAALETARSGSYSEEEIGEKVSPERLKRFFTHKEGRYQIVKSIRDQIVFAAQNLTADPPFSKLHLISCRNLLIYLDQQVQREIVAQFHYALRDGGFLFLGSAETTGDREDLFEPISKKWRIYRRIGIGRRMGMGIPAHSFPKDTRRHEPGVLPVWREGGLIPGSPRMSLASTAQQVLLERFAPACVIIDRKLQVLYIHGAVEDYLTFPAGEVTTLVVDMAREGLRTRLRGAISKCVEANKSVSVIARVRRGKKSVPIKATVTPLKYPREADGLLLVTLEEYGTAGRSRRRTAGGTGAQEIEDELKITREELRSTIEQLEDSNDQLKASNEEVTATNEELQSTNEELETSKEELQSLNEELNTVNARLHEKVNELENANNDVVNFLSSTTIATVFLDKEFKVRRYTPAITRLMSVIPSDIGRPIEDIRRRFSDEALLDDARRVLDELAPVAKEVRADDGRWYMRRITPYRTQEDHIEGVVIAFVDIDDLKQTERALRESEERFRAVFEQAAIGSEQLDLDGRYLEGNDKLSEIIGLTHEEIRQRSFTQITNPEDLLREMPLVEELLQGKRNFYTIEKRYLHKNGEPVWVRVTSSLAKGVQKPWRISIIEDITERRQAEEALRRATERLEVAQRAAGCGVWDWDIETGRQEWSAELFRLFGLDPATDTSGFDTWRATLHPEDLQSASARIDQAVREATPLDSEYRVVHRGGQVRWIRALGRATYDAARRPLRMSGICLDVTERKQTEQALRESEERFRSLAEVMPHLVWAADAAGNARYLNRRWIEYVGREVAAAEERAQLIHPEDLPRVRECWREAIDTGTDFQCEYRMRRNDGEYRWFLTRSVISGNLESWIGTATDIHDLKLAEAALQRSLGRFELLAKTAEELLQAAEPQKVVNSLCRRVMEHLDCHAFFNFLVDDSAGKLHLNTCAGIPPEEAQRIEWLDYGVAVCGCAARDGCRIVAEHIPTTPDPRTELVKSYGIKSYACHPLVGVDGKVIGTLSFGSRGRETFSADDLSLMKAVADQAAVAMIRMKSEQTLRRTAEELARSNKDLEQFAYVSSHDLSEPLRMVSGFVQLLRDRYSDTFDDKARGYMGFVVEGAARMQQLIDDLLAYSRVSAASIPNAAASAQESLDRALSLLCGSIEESRATITSDPMPTVWADGTQLAQVFQNLIGNAIKFRSGAPPEIHVGVKKDKGCWTFWVKDNGIGLDSQFRDRIFVIFQRLHTRDKYPGTGIGLAICKKIVERHGGRIWVESVLGNGSTFFFTIQA